MHQNRPTHPAELFVELAETPDLSTLASVAVDCKEAVATLWIMTYGGWNPSEHDLARPLDATLFMGIPLISNT